MAKKSNNDVRCSHLHPLEIYPSENITTMSHFFSLYHVRIKIFLFNPVLSLINT